jgi:transglutaminase-like putative cysteine protease
VKALGGGRIEVTVAALSQADGRAPPDAVDSQPTRWLQSNDEQLRKLATGAIAGASDDRARMLKLEKFVREYITRKNLRVGYASALETVRSREGDCTEHALLLAALGRSAGIPTRVVDGLAYTASFGGRTHLFVPHAWAQAWVDGRWQSYDAALAGFDAGHIALNVGDGDPAGFYAGVSLLGRIRLERVEVVAP